MRCLDACGDLCFGEDRRDRQQSQSGSATYLAFAMIRIFDPFTEHLIAATNTDDRATRGVMIVDISLPT